MKKPQVTKMNWPIGGADVPVKIYQENRRNIRASIGKTAAFLRMPFSVSPSDKAKHLDWFKQWLIQHFSKNPNLAKQFKGKVYTDGQILAVGFRTYTLKFHKRDRSNYSGVLKEGTLHLTINPRHEMSEQQEGVRYLVSRLVTKDFLPAFRERVLQLNQQFFQQDIGHIRLKNTQRTWGSCSAKRNLNFSNRLLFAPQEVIDYVIIHELAHLIEMNHSKAFWGLVARAKPNYKDQEKWLKEMGSTLGF